MGHKPGERLFMWAGGKSRMINHYEGLLAEVDCTLPYVEPFAGGAALFEHVRSKVPGEAHLSDVNGEIIGLYRLVRDDPTFLIQEMKRLEQRWMPLDTADRKSLYYELRQLYWDLPEGRDATALLYFLMKTGFNGIWQTCKASKGRYGTPAGLARQKTGVFSPDVIESWSRLLKGSRIDWSPYQDVEVTQKSFVFCDPPYRDSFTTYGTDFGDAAQSELIAWCRDIHARTGSTVWLCNRDAGDGFFEREAPDAVLHRFPITYTAGRRKQTADGFEAKKAVELLLVWT